MNKGGIGVGSASIVLVFAVLCLTVFSLITLVVARNNKALAETEASLVAGYYEADALAERIIAEIIETGAIPESVLGVEIDTYWDMMLGTEVASYFCQLSDKKELYVKLAVNGDYVNVLNWQMLDVGEWEFDDSLGVWIGDDMPGMPGMPGIFIFD